MRLNSHAYLSKLEADEAWVDINFRDLTDSEAVWSTLERTPPQDLPMDLTPQEYLHAILPSEFSKSLQKRGVPAVTVTANSQNKYSCFQRCRLYNLQ